MAQRKRGNDSVHWYMNELTSRIVAESGIPTDRFHLGKMILQSFKDEPEFVVQIDGATGESENSKSVLKRTVQCANCFKNLGLKTGDVMVLMAPNHLDLEIPFYAALYLGIIIATVDETLRLYELQGAFSVIKPKIVFCQSQKAPDAQVAVNELHLNAHIVTFDKGDYLCDFKDFLQKYGDTSVDDFNAADFNPEDTIAFLIATSGTTGLPKQAAVTHMNFAVTTPYHWSRFFKFPTPTERALIGSNLQWITAIVNYVISPVLRFTKLTTSEIMNEEHVYHLINEYRPTFTLITPTLMALLMKPGVSKRCDFTCFDMIMLGGSPVSDELLDDIKSVAPNTEIVNVYGMTELTGIGFQGDDPAPGSCGKPLGCFQYRLIDMETAKDITEPNVRGELWMKGPGIIKEYYNNLEETKNAFADGAWFKTGDMFYRDENWNFFFVERIKFLFEYNDNHVSPVEVEGVIRKHPGVLDVAVTSVPDPQCGDLPVACVVRRPGSAVTAQEIKLLVKEFLSDTKQLRGGVIFMDALPQLASTKIHRRRLKDLAMTMIRE